MAATVIYHQKTQNRFDARQHCLMDQEDATTIVSTPSHVKFKDYNPLPGSTGEADGGIQSLRFHFTKNSGNSVPVEKLAGYRREDYELLLYDIRAGNVTALRRAI